MRKRVQIALAVLLVGVVGAVAWQVLQSSEPVYQGKTVGQWLVAMTRPPGMIRWSASLDSRDQDVVALEAIESMGKEALPGLIQILKRRPRPPLLEKVDWWAVRFHLERPTLRLDDWKYRAAWACCILSEKDVDITSAIPALAQNATNAVPWNATNAFRWRRIDPFMDGLVCCGPRGVSIVTNLLAQSTSPQIRQEAASALGHLKIRTREVANALLSASRDIDVNVRERAIMSLGGFLREKKGMEKFIVSEVIPRLQDTNGEVRLRTIQFLLSDYGSAPGVADALSNLLHDPVPDVRSQAEQVLGLPSEAPPPQERSR